MEIVPSCMWTGAGYAWVGGTFCGTSASAVCRQQVIRAMSKLPRPWLRGVLGAWLEIDVSSLISPNSSSSTRQLRRCHCTGHNIRLFLPRDCPPDPPRPRASAAPPCLVASAARGLTIASGQRAAIRVMRHGVRGACRVARRASAPVVSEADSA
jgi:hypothetical protein